MPEAEKLAVKNSIKEGLEDLKGKIPGLVDIKVITEVRIASSTADLMLDSTFESADALQGYLKNPTHVEVAQTKVRPYIASRSSFDFEVV